jgi:hypothetical protein
MHEFFFFFKNGAWVVETLKHKRLASSAVYSLYSISRFHFHSGISSSIFGYHFPGKSFLLGEQTFNSSFFLLSRLSGISLSLLLLIFNSSLCFLFICCPFHLLEISLVISILSGLLSICSYSSLIIYFLVNLHYATYDINY